jgi:hypothetical protein
MILVGNMLGSRSGGSGEESEYGTLSLTLPKTQFYYGEVFNTTGVSVIYTSPDGDVQDVTDAVLDGNNLRPGEGSKFDNPGEITVRATYTPSGGTPVYAKVIVNVSEASQGYLTATMSKTTYVHGDTFNASVLTISYTDPEGNVSDISPADVNLKLSPNNGDRLEIDGTNTLAIQYTPTNKDHAKPDPVYLHFEVQAIPDYLTVRLRDSGLRINEPIDYTGAVINVVYTDRSQKKIVYGNDSSMDARISWVPDVGTRFDSNGDETIKAVYTENTKQSEGTTSVTINTLTLTDLYFDLTNAKKTSYTEGENFNATGWFVKAKYDDGSTKDVTKNCDLDPSDGEALKYDVQNGGVETVFATYTENDITKIARHQISIARHEKKPISIRVSMPDKGLRVGQAIDYSRAKVVLYYDYGSTEDVTKKVTWSPTPGTVVNSAGSTQATATYSSVYTNPDGTIENIKLTDSFSFSVTSLTPTALAFSIDKTRFDSGETINYDDLHAKATVIYNNATSRDVTNDVSWEPSNNSKLTTDDRKIRASYRENGVVVKSDKNIVVGNLPTKLEVLMYITSYTVGDVLDFYKTRCFVTYSNGKEVEVSIDDVWCSPNQGTQLDRVGTQYITCEYSAGGKTVTDRISVTVNAKKE